MITTGGNETSEETFCTTNMTRPSCRGRASTQTMMYPPYWTGGSHLLRRFVQKIDNNISASFYEPNRVFRNATANRQKNAQCYGYKFKEYWDGHEVKVHQNGCVRLYVSAAKPALKFWTPKNVFAACEESSIPAVIEFSPEGLFLVLGSSVIFERSWRHLSQMKPFGNEWIKQIEKELAYKRSDARAGVGSEKIAFKKRSISADHRPAVPRGLACL
jgi:hypothetical protein